MSNVAIKTEVVQAPQLLVCLDVRHYYICVFLIGPFLAEQLVQVDGLERADFSRIFNQLVQVPLLSLFTLFALLREVQSCGLTGHDSFLALLLIPVVCHRAELVEDFGP